MPSSGRSSSLVVFALKGVLADGPPDELRRRRPQTLELLTSLFRAPRGLAPVARVARTKRANMPTTMDQALDRLNADFAAAGRDAQYTGSSITLNAWLTEYLASNPQPPAAQRRPRRTPFRWRPRQASAAWFRTPTTPNSTTARTMSSAGRRLRTRTTKYQGAVRDRPRRGDHWACRHCLAAHASRLRANPVALGLVAAAARAAGRRRQADGRRQPDRRDQGRSGDGAQQARGRGGGRGDDGGGLGGVGRGGAQARDYPHELDGGDPASAWLRSNGANSVLLKMYDQAQATEEKPDNGELKVHELVEVYGLIERASEEPINISLGEDYASICMACPMEGVEEGTPLPESHGGDGRRGEARGRRPPHSRGFMSSRCDV